MKSSNDLWEDIGSLGEDELFHVVTKLFAMYEEQLKRQPESEEARFFFEKLESALTQTAECNGNRR